MRFTSFETRTIRRAALAVLLFASGGSPALHATVTLPALFSDHMVLQQSPRTPVWGKARPGERVSISFDRRRTETTADTKGDWKATLDLSDARPEPGLLVVEGENRIEIQDVLVGQVWLCAGQSNMEFQLSRDLNAEKEIAGSRNPLLREFKVGREQSRTPLDTCSGTWVPADPRTAGRFSAVGYYFGKKIQAELGVPVGLVTAAVGDTPCEAWTSYEALSREPDLKSAADRDIAGLQDYSRRRQEYAGAYRAWEKSHHREDVPNEIVAKACIAFTDINGWTPVKVPGIGPAADLDHPGALWFVRTVEVRADIAGRDIERLGLGQPQGFEAVYWNGHLVGKRTPETIRGEDENREYKVPGEWVLAGKNILAIRLFNAAKPPTLSGKIAYPGAWHAKVETVLAPLSDAARESMPPPLLLPPDPKKAGSYLFNGMIHPLIPYAVSGFVWYQGETNQARAWRYRAAFTTLIKDWRAHWDAGDLPFYYCQLASYNAKTHVPAESDWAELRESQSCALALPNTGMAVLIDAGEAADIHPRNKQIPGERLAAIALAKTYRKNVPYSGPVFKTQSVEGSRIRVHFDHTEGGLVAASLPDSYWVSTSQDKKQKLVRTSPDSQLEGFAICGADRKWVWAKATIDGTSVVVENAAIAQPVAVRYAWARNPTANLYNGAGFPASPFRTDDFPPLTGR